MSKLIQGVLLCGRHNRMYYYDYTKKFPGKIYRQSVPLNAQLSVFFFFFFFFYRILFDRTEKYPLIIRIEKGLYLIFLHNFCFSILQSVRISSKVRLIIQYTTNIIYFIKKLVFHQKSSNDHLQNFELYYYGTVPVLIIWFVRNFFRIRNWSILENIFSEHKNYSSLWISIRKKSEKQ